jgi:squalene cyclase
MKAVDNPSAVALEGGTQFLVAKQSSDGLWRDFHTPAGEASEWTTGFVAAALQRAGAGATALARAAEALVAGQHEDGGWGYNATVPSDADSTACVLLFLARTGRCAGSCARAASCLLRHQRPETGGVATYDEPGPIRRFMGVGRWMRFKGWCSPQVEVTATAGCALAALGPAHPAAGAAWRYVRSRQRADGSWGSYWWTSAHYGTLQAVELALAHNDVEPVGRAADWAVRSQGADGGWGAPGASVSAFATALSLSILVRAGVRGRPVQRAISTLAALQEDDGGWASHPIMRIPTPGDAAPDRWRPVRLGGGVVVQDEHRTFTSAACVAALARCNN